MWIWKKPCLEQLLSRVRWILQTKIVAFIFLATLSVQHVYALPVEEVMQTMDIKETKQLKKLFRSCLELDCLGYVLFGDTKPMCFAYIHKTKAGETALEGWEVWKRISNNFQYPNFLFVVEEKLVNNERTLDVFVINKTTFNALVHKETAFLKERLGEDFDPDTFLQTIEEKGCLRPLIGYDDAVFGVLLGYGIESSMAYQVKHEKINKPGHAPKQTSTYKGIRAKRPPGSYLSLISFLGNPKSEAVQALIQKYSEETQAIWDLCRDSKDLVSLILQALNTEVCPL